MQFKEVIGLEESKQQLLQAYREGRTPHAQLFAGPPGNGKIALALAFAQFLNCENQQPKDSCGQCRACRKYSKLIHPDLHFVFPVIKTDKIKEPTATDYIEKWRNFILESPYPSPEKWINHIADENKQGMIYVYEGKEIIRKLNQKAFEAKHKVVIIWLPEKMNPECANKILKIVEEPPSKSIFLMVTEHEEQIISTIRSRCQLVRVPKIKDHEMETALAQHPALGTSNPSEIARLAQGNFILANDIIRNDELRAYNHSQFAGLMRNGYARDFQALLSWSDELATVGRARQKSFLTYCTGYLRENFLLNLNNPDLVFMDDSERKFSTRFAPFINEKNVLSLFTIFETAYRDVSANGNAKIIFTDLSLSVSRLIRP